MKAVELAAGHLTLQPYTPAHDRSTVDWLNGEDLRQSFGLTRNVTLESHRRWLESSTDTIVWAIHSDEQGHCGNVLVNCNLRHRSGYFQIYIGERQARGSGVGKLALRAVLDYLFFELDLHRVWLHTMPGNTAAERLYAGAGFVSEGIERESILRSGEFCSQERWAILAMDWRNRQGKAVR